MNAEINRNGACGSDCRSTCYKNMKSDRHETGLSDQAIAKIGSSKGLSNPNQIASFDKDINAFFLRVAARLRAQIEAAEMK